MKILWMSLLLILCASIGSAETDSNRSTGVAAPPRADVEQAVSLAAGYLEQACSRDGKFVYEVDSFTGNQRSDYDIIRHAGAVYALGMFFQHKPDQQAAEAIIRAAGYLRRNYVGPGPHSGQLAVWSKPVSEKHAQYAELGGTGLGILALTAAQRLDARSVSIEDLQALGRFVLFLQRDDGSFVHKYGAMNGPNEKWTSLYYPGEAVLGLLALYQLDHSDQWLNAAMRSLVYLAKRRERLEVVPPDHWALIATAEMLPLCRRGCDVSPMLVHHAIQICTSILRDQIRGSGPSDLDGAFDATGRTTPTAARMEGLLAALRFLPNGDVRERVEAAARRGIGFLLRAQYSDGRYAGALPAAIRISAFGSSNIRVDYVQHALCAWLRYEQIE